MTSKIEQLELLKAMAERRPDYYMEVLSYNEALRNSAPLLLEIVKAAKKLSDRHDWHHNMGKCICSQHIDFRLALQKFEESELG